MREVRHKRKDEQLGGRGVRGQGRVGHGSSGGARISRNYVDLKS